MVRIPRQNLLERQIEATAKQIDALVCDLYALTEDEIRIVEGGENCIGLQSTPISRHRRG